MGEEEGEVGEEVTGAGDVDVAEGEVVEGGKGGRGEERRSRFEEVDEVEGEVG